MLHLPKLENIGARPIYYHIYLKLGRPEQNQCIILPHHTLLWPCPSKALSWACHKAVLHGSRFCRACPCSASSPLLALAYSALIVPCTKFDLALLALSLPVPLGCPGLDKSLTIRTCTDTFVKLLGLPNKGEFFKSRVALRHNTA